jgi:hypothetical protein
MTAKAAVKGRRAVGGWVAELGTRIQGTPAHMANDESAPLSSQASDTTRS